MRRISFLLIVLLAFFYACSDREDEKTSDILQDASMDVLVGSDTEVNDVPVGSDAEVNKEDYAFIINAAPDYSSGSFSIMKLSDKGVTKDKGVIHSDAVARYFGDYIYVINRMGADNITIYDPNNDFSIVKQFSVGAGTNPQDVALYNGKIYITKQLSNEIDIFRASNYSKIGSIDISKYADKDGYAEPQDILLYKDRLYVTILRLDKDNYYSPTDKSYLIVIDPSTDKIEKEILLGSTNPFAGMVIDEENERIIIAETGSFGATDGRVEFYSINDGIITQSFVSESEWGGDLNKIAYSRNKIFAVISDSNFNTLLKVYDTLSSKMSDVYQSQGFNLAGIAIYNGSDLFLCDRTKEKPGLRIFDIESLKQKTENPIDTGLPPVSLIFFKR
ncbi:MAG: YncE family protein [Myxococcota bacterium]